MTKGKALIAAREEFGPAAHVKIMNEGVIQGRVVNGVHEVGFIDLMGFKVLGAGENWEQAFEEARKK